uniref:NADH-ubiquinone oxidoreductase chain 1 n=1 Tax=Hanleyella oldroydi TaxID=515356 RepID=A0A6H1PGP0_9MOLL|nr:NADH dehydrogenase subunit 1 [Hanleyella oldroydi]QIZ12615.1 NADH dehydrogenase subunit 1 [Hanleyella oldroydi]
MLMSFLSLVISYILVLLAVAFFTLLERKGLGYFQVRKGPNKVGYEGIIQPLADALKLFCKEQTKLVTANSIPYFIAPIVSLLLALCLWGLYLSSYSVWFFSLSVLFFLSVSAFNVYGTLIAGWASNSKYVLLGALRAVAQTISYEISLALILLCCLCYSGKFSFMVISQHNLLIWSCFLFFPIFCIWFTSCLAETNRAPFDFAEGESELVSGFNIEYGSGGFALIFMAEYANILFMSLLTTLLFLGTNSILFFYSDLLFWLKVSTLAFLFIWVRATFPRFRYDLLMSLTWKSFLPLALLVLSLTFSGKFFIMIL